MVQTTLYNVNHATLHVAVVMDGSGRWALSRGLPRPAGHRQGAVAARRTVEEALRLGRGTLTLFAFSCDNWKRPPEEVDALMHVLRAFVDSGVPLWRRQGVRVSVAGRRDRLPGALLRAACGAEKLTAGGDRLHLRLAIDYSSRHALLAAHAALAPGRLPRPAEFSEALGSAMGEGEPAPDVDLLIRTGGERRLSDFMLWECAYAELLFLDKPWPDFTGEDLRAALADYGSRERRFGGLGAAAAGGARGAS